jgi:hypothetical protein
MNPNHKTSKTYKTEDLIFDSSKMNFNDYIEKNAIMFIPTIKSKMLTMGGLKLDLLPPLVKEYFIKWIFEINRRRLEQGLPLMITYDIIKQCPLWKIIPMPYRNYSLNKETMSALNKIVPAQSKLKINTIK